VEETVAHPRRHWFKTILAVVVLTAISFAQADKQPPQVGEGSLLYRSPVTGRFEQVPLTHTDVSIDVRGPVASATVTQQYANSSSQPIEAVYIFPLPHDAAVYDMEIRVGNRIIRSVIREREEAKKVYEAAKSAGKRAALVEEERPNVFTTSVANIMPGDHIDVRLRYVEPLRWDDGKLRLTFPMVVGPRYIPGTEATVHSGTGWAFDTNSVPDASRITPVVNHPENRSGHDISLAVDLDPGFSTASIKCISHQVNVQQRSDGHQHVELAAAITLPNKDFVLELQQARSVQPETALFLSPGKGGETHFLLAAFPPTVQPTKRQPVEMLYLIDISGSMEGTSIQQAREALLQALDRLSPNDRFGIVAFNDRYRDFSPQPLPATTDNLNAARTFVKNLNANGGTEMLPALLHLMQQPSADGYLRHIVLLTDGDLGNEEEIFAALGKNLGNARLFTVAIGSAPNHFLATKMAQFGRGTFTQIADITEIREQMAHLLDSIENPVLSDIKLTFEGVEVSNVYPERPPDLFLRQPLLIYGHITKGHVGKVHLNARANNEAYRQTIAFETSKASFHPGITTLWARQRVEDMMDTWRQSEENARTEIRNSIIRHAIQYRLVTRFTSLVAVEEVVVNPGGENNTVPVPTELPDGMQMDKVFGAPATGTEDDFLQALGLTLLLTGLTMLYVIRKRSALA
jgi:Ca-activated chloride channel family protein